MTKKRHKNSSSAITMEKFLVNYCRIEDRKLLDMLCSLTHKEQKRIRGNALRIKPVPFEAVTEEAIANGDIIFVRDVHDHIAPYRNPNRKVENEYESDCQDEIDFIESAIDSSVIVFEEDEPQVSTGFVKKLKKQKNERRE